MIEVENALFSFNSNNPTEFPANGLLYPTFQEYLSKRGERQEEADASLHQVLEWMDHLIVRYCWAVKRWPKRATFHSSYYRDVYRVRVFDKLDMPIDDLAQELRLFVLTKVRQYRCKYKAPIGGYISKALYYGVKKLWRQQCQRRKLEEVLLYEQQRRKQI